MPNFSEITSLNAGMLVFAGAIVLILLVSIFFVKKKSLYLRFFVALLIFNAIMLLSEGFLLVFEGRERFQLLIKTFMFTTIISSFITSTLWIYSILSYTKEKIKISSIYGYAMMIVCALEIVLIVVSIFDKNLVYMNDKYYVEYTEAYSIIDALNILMALIKVVVVVCLRKPLTLTSKAPFVLFIILSILSVSFEWFWKTTPAYLINTLLSATLYFMINNEMREIISTKEEELSESKITIMLSQIQPHFLYNTLTSIASLCDIDPLEAKRVTINFSNYLRGNINSLSSTELIPFEQELNHINCYLEIEKVRFKDRVNFEFDIQEKNFKLPPLSIQPLVENAVKHGICKKKEGGTVKISSLEDENNYIVEIEDNGVGFDINEKKDDNRKHIGIENVESRLKKMCKGYLKIESKLERGSKIKVFIPKSNVVKGASK